MTERDPRVPALWADFERRLKAVETAQQLSTSTIGDTDDDAVAVDEAVADAATTNTSMPDLQDAVASANDGLTQLDERLAASDAELDARLELASTDLEVAREEIEEAQAEINAAFGQTVDGLSENVDTAIRAAGDAKTEAEAASDAALAAAGLAATKGKTIVQVSKPTGANADPANLWINISTDSNGVPKNQPNRYDPSIPDWVPVTDAQAVTAAQNAASAVAAAQAAKDVADQANAAAGVAKTAADNANTAALQAAGIANGKGKVIYQAAKPTGANAAAGNLWIRTSDNTPWAYDATIPDWVQVTDQTAKDAASAAVAAQQAATAAANAASAAQATADSKPLILFSSTAGPSGTAPTGTIWFLWDSAKNVAGQWLQSGTLANPVWTPQQIRSEVIANLDVAKLTAGSAAIADLVAQKIAASTANFQTVNVSNLFVTSGATLSQAVIDYLFANVVQAKKITAGMIDVDSLNGISLTGVKVVGGSLSTSPNPNDQYKGTVSIALDTVTLSNSDPNSSTTRRMSFGVQKNAASSGVYSNGYIIVRNEGGTSSVGFGTNSWPGAPVMDVDAQDIAAATLWATAYKVLTSNGVPKSVVAQDALGNVTVQASNFQAADGTSILSGFLRMNIPTTTGTSGQSLATGSVVQLTGLVKHSDSLRSTSGWVSSTSSSSVVLNPGVYLITTNFVTTTRVSSRTFLSIFRDGTEIQRTAGASEDQFSGVVTIAVPAGTTSTIDMRFYQASGSTMYANRGDLNITKIG